MQNLDLNMNVRVHDCQRGKRKRLKRMGEERMREGDKGKTKTALCLLYK